MLKVRRILALLLAAATLPAQVLPKQRLAQQYFGNDAPWFVANVPFLEIDDPEIQQVYYYRWKLYRSHIREIGPQGTDITEFLEDVPWARHPYTDLNDSSSFHLMEGRWLRDPTMMTDLVDHLYAGGGNDRHFSESIAAATYAWTQVTGDPALALRHLDAMQHVYNLWDDHFDAARNLYWIEPILDATEYTISSIDASGAGFADPPPQPTYNGFLGGQAFRPSINAYQFANAQAIAALAHQAQREDIAADYTRRANALRFAVETQLWNPGLHHFTDIYQRSTKYVTAGDFIRGRELAGFVPWMYDLPSASFAGAWTHVLGPNELGGPYGLRTVEPTYARYLKQYRYDAPTGLPECQWNGPAWPFQTSQTLTGLAHLLHAGPSQIVTADDYVRLLRQYTHMHLNGQGIPDLQEDYNPDTGKPIVGLPRSHHYNHSTYIDLILTGLLGIQPRSDNVFEIDPILRGGRAERPIRFFALEGLRYHGHDLTLLYDVDGTRYHRGAGLTVLSDGVRLSGPSPLHHTILPLPQGPAIVSRTRNDIAVNVWGRAPSAFEADLPIATASSTAPDSELYQAIDGRHWFFPEIANGWSPATCSVSCWYAVDLRHPTRIASVELAFFADGNAFATPNEARLQTLTEQGWTDIPSQSGNLPIANGIETIRFAPITTQQIRVVLKTTRPDARLRLIELKAFGP